MQPQIVADFGLINEENLSLCPEQLRATFVVAETSTNEPGESDHERFSFVVVFGKRWGQYRTQLVDHTLMRESVPCTVFMFRCRPWVHGVGWHDPRAHVTAPATGHRFRLLELQGHNCHKLELAAWRSLSAS